MLRDRLNAVLPDRYAISSISDDAARAPLEHLNGLVGQSASLMPPASFVEISSPSSDSFLTLIRNDARLNITSILGEKKSRLPAEDSMTVVPGFLGAYPNAFFLVDELELDRFADQIAALRTEADYSQLLDDYGIRRTDQDFWRQSDTFHSAAREDLGFEFGLFDYGRFENR